MVTIGKLENGKRGGAIVSSSVGPLIDSLARFCLDSVACAVLDSLNA